MQIIYKKLEEIRPYEKNPRKNEEAVEYVANSIKEFGFKVPIIIDKDGVIVAGHTRYKASIRLGLEEVPTITADDLTEEQIKAFRLADNKVAEKAKWDKGLLKDELDSLYGIIDMSNFDFPIQIEDIDLDDIALEPSEKIAVELNECNDYVVLQFNTIRDWEKAIDIFGLERVATCDKNKNIRRFGIGRVIDGKPILERLEGKDEY